MQASGEAQSGGYRSTVTAASATAAGSATDVALTVTVAGLGTRPGAP
jgi:hypothetical protein